MCLGIWFKKVWNLWGAQNVEDWIKYKHKLLGDEPSYMFGKTFNRVSSCDLLHYFILTNTGVNLETIVSETLYVKALSDK